MNIRFSITVSPIVLLRVGSSANLKGIKEGDNVSFECNVRSNPRNFTLTWYHGVNIHLDF
jgi:Cu/Ag efflux protein CusF